MAAPPAGCYWRSERDCVGSYGPVVATLFFLELVVSAGLGCSVGSGAKILVECEAIGT